MTWSRRLGLNKLLWLAIVATPPVLLASSAPAAESCHVLIVRCQHACVAKYEPILKKRWTVAAQNERTACINACETRSYGECEGEP